MSARKLTLAARARADLEDILLYTELEWGERQAEIYREIIHNSLDTLLRFPYLGRKRDDLAPGLLTYPAGEHIVFYRVTDDELVIRRFAHSRQDYESFLW